MSAEHRQEDVVGTVTHYFSHLGVAAVTLAAPLKVGEKIRIHGHTTDIVQEVGSLEIEHAHVDEAQPGDDVAIKVVDHVREHDRIYREPA